MNAGAILAKKAGIKPTAPPDPAPALRRILRRAADRALGLDVTVTGGQIFEESLTEILASIDPTDMVIALERGRELAGAAVIQAAFWRGLVEVQMLGQQVLPRRGARKATISDAALASPYLTAALDEFRLTRVAPLAQIADHISVGARVELPRVLELGLTAPNVTCISCQCALDAGEPATLRLFTVSAEPSPRARAPEVDAPGWSELWQDVALNIPCRLEAVLHRMTVPLAQLHGLADGHVLPLGPADLGHLRLESADGTLAARGRLGRAGSVRAVRIETPAATVMDELPIGGVTEVGGATEALGFDTGPSVEAGQEDPGGLGVAAIDALDPIGAPDVNSAATAFPDLPAAPGLDSGPEGIAGSDSPDLPMCEIEPPAAPLTLDGLGGDGAAAPDLSLDFAAPMELPEIE